METEFILRDVRLVLQSLPTQAVYLKLWALAVHERREILRPKAGAIDHQSASKRLAREINVRPNDFARALCNLLLPECGLIQRVGENGIRVVGVRSKHPQLQWKEEPEFSPNGEWLGCECAPNGSETKSESKSKSTPISPQEGAQIESDPLRSEKDGFYAQWNALAARKFVKPFDPDHTTKTWQNVEKLLDKHFATAYFRNNQTRLFSMLPDASWLATVWIPRLEQFLGNNDEHIPHYEVVLNEGYRDAGIKTPALAAVDAFKKEYEAAVRASSPYGLSPGEKEYFEKKKKELGIA